MNLNRFYSGVLSFLSDENTTPILENSSNIQSCTSGFPENGVTGQGFKYQPARHPYQQTFSISHVFKNIRSNSDI